MTKGHVLVLANIMLLSFILTDSVHLFVISKRVIMFAFGFCRYPFQRIIGYGMKQCWLNFQQDFSDSLQVQCGVGLQRMTSAIR